MKTMYILRGASGSGKSTFAKSLKGYVCSADDYFIKPDGSYQFNGNQLGKAHEFCY